MSFYENNEVEENEVEENTTSETGTSSDGHKDKDGVYHNTSPDPITSITERTIDKDSETVSSSEMINELASAAQNMADNDSDPISISAMIDSGGYSELDANTGMTVQDFLQNNGVDVYNAIVTVTPKPSSGRPAHSEFLTDLEVPLDEHMFYNVSSKKQTGGTK